MGRPLKWTGVPLEHRAVELEHIAYEFTEKECKPKKILRNTTDWWNTYQKYLRYLVNKLND